MKKTPVSTTDENTPESTADKKTSASTADEKTPAPTADEKQYTGMENIANVHNNSRMRRLRTVMCLSGVQLHPKVLVLNFV